MSDRAPHIPVLPTQVIESLRPEPGQTFVDCTLGLGGHARLLLERITPGGTLVALDFDPHNMAAASEHLSYVRGGNVILRQTNFASIDRVLREEKIEQVDGILADLGVASTQIDDPARGFSYRRSGPLDMRMDPTRKQSAADILAKISEEDLRDALLELGDEDDAPEIARLVVERRKEKPITTTDDLTAIICEARDFTLQRAAGAKLHPAARSFQALRILTNRETHNLDRLLTVAPTILKPGGRIAIISFHSGEDRRVKQNFRDALRAGDYSEVSRDCLIASEVEVKSNPRSRSAKLRWAKRA